ncbi:MAG: type IX secretion system membrane protein PorP/SprF [Sphingobacteriaceae bacterium]|nr:type IX secretion system membrane protein PorP/SprF [Sphingobacteriaceae bacterium]
MKKYLYIFIFSLLLVFVNAQQLPQYTQYMLNELAINPAVSGKEEYADVRTNNRLQWIGITDAPRTYMLTAHGPIKDKNMGLGMNLYTDIVGPTRRTGINFSYAYHLKLKEDLHLSMGLSAGVLQWGIDGHKLILHDPGDENLLVNYQTTYVPDFGTGIYFHKKDRFYFGFSVPQLYQAKIGLYEKNSKSRLASHYNLNGAYKFDLNEDFKIEPSFLVKYAIPAPPKFDGGLRVIYKETIWLGGAYRHNDSFTALIGYLYKNYLMVGYSYDYTTTNIRKYSTGTHELMLGIRFTKKQSSAWEQEVEK